MVMLKCPSCEEEMEVVQKGLLSDVRCWQCPGCGYEEARGDEDEYLGDMEE